MSTEEKLVATIVLFKQLRAGTLMRSPLSLPLGIIGANMLRRERNPYATLYAVCAELPDDWTKIENRPRITQKWQKYGTNSLHSMKVERGEDISTLFMGLLGKMPSAEQLKIFHNPERIENLEDMISYPDEHGRYCIPFIVEVSGPLIPFSQVGR